MSKSVRKSLAISLAATFCIGAVPFTSVSAAERNYKEQDVTAYMYSAENKESMKCLFFEDMPNVPYINVKDYLESVTAKPFTVTGSGSVYTVTSKDDKTMVIDAEKDTVHFDEFETFMPTDPADADGDGPEAPYIKNLKIVYDSAPKAVDFDYGEYRIDIVSAGDSVYFPLSTLADLFSDTYLSALYLDGNIYFYEPMKPLYFDSSSAFTNKPREKDIIAYTYYELCFMFDRLFGKPPKSELGKSLSQQSFDELLDSTDVGKNVKQLLLSESRTDFYAGLVMLDIMADDGGHTQLSDPFNTSLMNDEKTEFNAAVTQMIAQGGDEKATVIAAKISALAAVAEETEALKKYRNEVYANYEVVKTWTKEAAGGEEPEVVSQLVMSGDTAVFVFDSFEDEVVPYFKWSLDHAEEKGAKNFLIDLSCNTGGSSSVLCYMMSIMTGKSDMHMNCTVTGNDIRTTGLIDRNLDGVVDEKDDAVNYNFRFALLTTKLSYSCANYLPCLAQEQLIPVIGETSGGGTCMILNMSYPSLASYSVSGYKTMLYDKGGNVEAGAKVNLETVTYGSDKKPDYSKLYDISAVSSFLNEYYSKTTPTKSTEPQAPSYASSGKAMPTVVIVIIAVCAALAIAAVVLVLVLIRKKKKNIN